MNLPGSLVATILMFTLAFYGLPTVAGELVRGRELGIPFEGTPGPLNGITDIAGIEVGSCHAR